MGDLDQAIERARARLAAQREAVKATFERSPGGLISWQGVPWAGPHKARKATASAWSGRAINPGDLVYSPVSNGNKRMLRVLADEWPDA